MENSQLSTCNSLSFLSQKVEQTNILVLFDGLAHAAAAVSAGLLRGARPVLKVIILYIYMGENILLSFLILHHRLKRGL